MRALLGLLFIFGTAACSTHDQGTSLPRITPINLTKKVNMENENNWKILNTEEARVIVNKGTEYPFTGRYNDHKEIGVYHCKRCHTALFSSEDKFNSGSGWPSFDDAIGGAVAELMDADGRRSEIVCANCEGHLGHVFRGENMTTKSTRHCVNSISLNFISESSLDNTKQAKIGQAKIEQNKLKQTNPKKKEDIAYFASGCFWGTEYYLQKMKGVLSTTVGYMGGTVKSPSYKEVCSGKTGHAEVVQVVYNPDSVSYRELAVLFFETHDPTQINRQGPDIGNQYRTEVFYTSKKQQVVANELIEILTKKGLKVATKVSQAPEFWRGEGYHQDYYQGNGGRPYCHSYQKKF